MKPRSTWTALSLFRPMSSVTGARPVGGQEDLRLQHLLLRPRLHCDLHPGGGDLHRLHLGAQLVADLPAAELLLQLLGAVLVPRWGAGAGGPPRWSTCEPTWLKMDANSTPTAPAPRTIRLLGMVSSSRMESELRIRLWSTFTKGSDLGTGPGGDDDVLGLQRLRPALPLDLHLPLPGDPPVALHHGDLVSSSSGSRSPRRPWRPPSPCA